MSLHDVELGHQQCDMIQNCAYRARYLFRHHQENIRSSIQFGCGGARGYVIVVVDDVFHIDIVAVVDGYVGAGVVADVVADRGVRSPDNDQPVASGGFGIGSYLGHFVVHDDDDEDGIGGDYEDVVGLDLVAGDL